MTFTNHWDLHDKVPGLYRKFTGSLSFEEILESNFELQADPRYLEIQYIINDFSAITGHNISPFSLKAYAETDNITSHKRHQKLKIALIAVQEEHQQIAHGYCQLAASDAITCRVFTSLDDAQYWVREAT